MIYDTNSVRAVLDEEDFIVMFTTEYCVACHHLTRTIRDMGINVYRIKVEHWARMADTYRLKFFPTLIFFKGRREVLRKTGSISAKTIRKCMKEVYDG